MQSITINLYAPRSWQELSEPQLRYVFLLLALEKSFVEIQTLCLLRWNGIRVVSYIDGQCIIRKDGNSYLLSSSQINGVLFAMEWIESLPDFPARITTVGKYNALAADFQQVPFETFLFCDNLYQGYLQTQDKALLDMMLESLYPGCVPSRLRSKEHKTAQINCFYWFAALKIFFSRRFKNFYKPLKDSAESSTNTDLPSKVQEAMDSQIRALTKGDITKEKEVLAMDTWRALTELDAQAREYEEIKRKYPDK